MIPAKRRLSDKFENCSDHDLLIKHTVSIDVLKSAVDKANSKLDVLSDKIEEYSNGKLDNSFFTAIFGIIAVFVVFAGGIYMADRNAIYKNEKDIAVIYNTVNKAKKNIEKSKER
jgi:hypothetical protein